MPVSFFITDQGELYADMGIQLDSDEIFAWLSLNGIDLGRKTSFTVIRESPVFETHVEAESWIRETFSKGENGQGFEVAHTCHPSEWGDKYVGKMIADDRLALAEAEWEFVGKEGRLFFGYQFKGDAYITTFAPTQSPSHHDVTIAIIIQTNGAVISGIRELVVLRDNWGNYQELDVGIFPPDINYARGLVEAILSEKDTPS